MYKQGFNKISGAEGSYFPLLLAANLLFAPRGVHDQKGAPSLSQYQTLGSRRSWGFLGTPEGHSPVVEQEEAGGQGDSELQPAPVRDGVGDGIEEQEPDGKGRLVEDPHRPPVLRAHHFCHCKRAQGQLSAKAAPRSRNLLGAVLEDQCYGNTLEEPWK